MLSFLFTKTPLKFYIQSIWRDEAFTYLLAKQNIIQILITTAKDSNPPLYYLLLHAWMVITGHSEFALRTFSFLFFVATLYVVGLFLIDVFQVPVRRALLFLVLFVASPVLHYYAFEARMYSLFAFTTSLSFYFLYKRDYRKYTIAVLLSLYTHYFTVFVLAGQILYLLLTDTRALLRTHLKMYLKIALGFIPWILIVLLSRPPVAGEFWIPKLFGSTFFNVPSILFTGYEQSQWFPYTLLPFMSVFFYGVIAFYIYAFLKKHPLLHLKVDHRKHAHLGLFLFCWVVPPLAAILLISLFRPIFLPRYTIFITIGFLLSLVYIINSFKRNITFILFALLLLCSFHYGYIQVAKRGKQDIRKPLLEIKKIMGKNDVVYVTHEFNFHPAQYYINEQQVYLYGKTYDKIPWYVGKVLFPKEKVTTTLPIYPRKAFILQDDLTYTIQALY